MKTAGEKAQAVVAELVSMEGGCGMDIFDDTELEAAITLALKEQDRDTRHACAEAVLVCKEGDAHSACMNARAI